MNYRVDDCHMLGTGMCVTHCVLFLNIGMEDEK
jgi:hypothetical protein